MAPGANQTEGIRGAGHRGLMKQGGYGSELGAKRLHAGGTIALGAYAGVIGVQRPITNAAGWVGAAGG